MVTGSQKTKVLIIGTHGVPPRYGGFETLVDNLIDHLQNDFDLGVTCYNKEKNNPKYYKGAKLYHIGVPASGKIGILYDFIGIVLALFLGYRNVIYLGPSFGALLLLTKLFHIKSIVNFGGLDEWSRPKYGKVTRALIKINYSLACKFGDILVADNKVVADSISSNFNKRPSIIKYGGDHVVGYNEIDLPDIIRNVEYALVVARAQEDTQLKEIIKNWPLSGIRLVIVSNWDVSDYGIEARSDGHVHPNIAVLDAIYNQDLLNSIRDNCKFYIHTHSLCGTAPSLVEMMFFSKPILSYDIPTNRETLNNRMLFWKHTKELNKLIVGLTEDELEKLKHQASELSFQYTWLKISKEYIQLLKSQPI